MFKYDQDKSILTTGENSYKLHTGQCYVHPLILDIIKWHEGDKTLQELYTDFLEYQLHLLSSK
ncbi:hypothetical protein VPIG_00107 [Vibrio phage PWH3a-P1]|uniref:hypothetical protein n=1 Tax=Vibrio phage PWH3a-P1 TaxID=754058 RepID=UPI0002C07BAF|nr:hypothetical protein VPIG_00107 [Vibrio phage PWH3a-P1]AGH31964.1 hypothetical protein VPIG_00107 [Vibrio phage PWH3a-P1]